VRPVVSVVMPVFNAGEFLAEAVVSILGQTMKDFELLLIDDASTDETPRIAAGLRDERIRYLRNNTNRGVAASLNRGLDEARGEFIARMDGDDISRPERLERQVSFLRSRPGLGICGSWIRCFGLGRPFTYRYPTGEGCVAATLLFANPMAHGSVMMRASTIRRERLRYDETALAAQDFVLWRSCRDRVAMDNIPAVLLDYRRHGASVSVRSSGFSRGRLLALLAAGLEEMEVPCEGEALLFHAEVGNGSGMRSPEELLRARKWLARLIFANAGRGTYDRDGLAAATARIWFNVCRNSAHLGFRAWKAWREGPCTPSPSPGDLLVFAATAAAGQLGRKGGFPQGRLDVSAEKLEP
jgi:glycosyltransferase involved in cell wall biosynthesis